jgi:tetratricopeptide (TPR) repeat protein
VQNYLRSIGLAVTVLLAVLPAASAPQEQQQAQESQPPAAPGVNAEIEAVQTILQTPDPQQRLTLVDEFLAQYPTSQYSSNVLIAAAEAHRMMNHFDKAVEFGERALENSPRDPVSMILVADSLSEGAQASQPDYEEKLNRAEDYSRRALSILPELFATVQRRPDVPEEQYTLREQYMEAQVHATLGYILFRRKQFEEAEKEFNLATQMNQLRPNPADFERLGVVQVERGNFEGAKVSFQRCQEIGGEAFQTCARRLEMVEKLMQKEQQAEKPPQE